MISLTVPAQAQIRPKAFAMSMNKETLTGTCLALSARSVAFAWMLDVPGAVADCRLSLKRGSARTARRRHQPPSVGCRVEPREPPATGSHAGGEFRDDLSGHVNGREATCIRIILLREGQAEAVVVQQPVSGRVASSQRRCASLDKAWRNPRFSTHSR
jgi:hypothetical protein